MQELSVTNNSRRLEFIVWGALILTVLAIAGAFIYKRLQTAPVSLPIIGPVGEFALTNQHGKTVSAADLRGKVWIANIVFTRCAGPCPLMTKAMKEIQDSTDPRVRLVTLTTDPDNDTPEVLKRYGEKFGADFNRWSFLTGSKDQIARLAVNGLKLVAQEKPAAERESPADLFIHSTLFVIVDQAGNLRAAYELDDPNLKSKVLEATRSLLKR
ncbi:MAG TPA: SCO family protein [Verrucomicrobiae bacterium]|nr:SCO family protein [Verrucomicrobiae bacterium]